MQPRREPLLWLQCLALGAIPLELLLIRLVLAGADPGPVPALERCLIWSVGVLGPAVALWQRPADWGSMLLLRQPLASRSSDQLRISAAHSGLSSRVAVAVAAVILLPVLWWLDNSAVLVSEFSPVSGQSRLVTLLLVTPLSALIIWQLQQLVQAALLLLGSTATVTSADATFRADAVATQRTSLGLQLLNLPPLEWPEPAAVQRGKDTETDQPNSEVADACTDEVTSKEENTDIAQTTTEDAAETDAAADMDVPDSDAFNSDDVDNDLRDNLDEPESEQTNNSEVADAAIGTNLAELESRTITPTTDEDEEDSEPEDLIDDSEDSTVGTKNASALDSLESVADAAAPLPVKPEQPGEEDKSTELDPEISQVDIVASGSTEGHGEQTEPSGRKESEPEQST